MAEIVRNVLKWPIDKTIPRYYEGEPRTCSQWLIDKISKDTQGEGALTNPFTFCFWATRVEAFALPIFLAGDVLIGSGVVIEATFNYCFWYGGKHKTPPEEFLRLLGTVTALFYEVIFIIPSIVAPCLLRRKPPEKSPETGDSEKAKTIEEKTEDKVISNLKREMRQQIYSSMPLYSAETDEIFCTYLQKHKISGITVKDPSFESLSDIATWGMKVNTKKTEEELRDHQEEEYLTPFERLQRTEFEMEEINNLEEFLHPEGTRVCVLKRSKLEDESLQYLLNTPHDVNRLVLDGFSVDEILDSEPTGILSKIHTLELTGKEISTENLDKIASYFPNIACYDLRQVTTISGDIREFAKTKEEEEFLSWGHIVLAHGFENVKEKNEELNHYLFDLVKEFKLDKANEFIFKFSSDPNFPFHPAAPFIKKVSFLRGMPLVETTFLRLFKRLKYSFPSMKTLDLSKCPRLAANNLADIAKLGLKKVILIDCKMLTYKRITNPPPDLQFEKSANGTTELHSAEATSGIYYLRRFDEDEKERTYKLSDHYLCDGLTQVLRSGCCQVDMHLTLVNYDAMRDVIHLIIDELTEKTYQEAKTRYAIRERGKLKVMVYPSRK